MVSSKFNVDSFVVNGVRVWSRPNFTCPHVPQPLRHTKLRPTSWGRCHWVWDGEYIGNAVAARGTFGPVAEITNALLRLRTKGNVHLVDLGSNVGLVSAAALAREAVDTVTCVEADESNAVLLKATFALNNWTSRLNLVQRAYALASISNPCPGMDPGTQRTSRVSVARSVVTDARARTSVSFQRGERGNRGSSRVDPHGLGGMVRTTDLAEIERGLPRNATIVLKLDIEGCEHAALRNARALLRRTAFVAAEISPQAMARQPFLKQPKPSLPPNPFSLCVPLSLRVSLSLLAPTRRLVARLPRQADCEGNATRYAAMLQAAGLSVIEVARRPTPKEVSRSMASAHYSPQRISRHALAKMIDVARARHTIFDVTFRRPSSWTTEVPSALQRVKQLWSRLAAKVG